MDQNTIKQLIQLISPELTWLLVQGFIVLVVFSIMRNFVSSVSDYIRLRFSLWGLNTKLNIYGKVGYIKEITFKEVIIHISEKETMYVPIDRFFFTHKIVYHNGYTGDEQDDF